jgi:hypothetical protein
MVTQALVMSCLSPQRPNPSVKGTSCARSQAAPYSNVRHHILKDARR